MLEIYDDFLKGILVNTGSMRILSVASAAVDHLREQKNFVKPQGVTQPTVGESATKILGTIDVPQVDATVSTQAVTPVEPAKVIDAISVPISDVPLTTKNLNAQSTEVVQTPKVDVIPGLKQPESVVNTVEVDKPKFDVMGVVQPQQVENILPVDMTPEPKVVKSEPFVSEVVPQTSPKLPDVIVGEQEQKEEPTVVDDAVNQNLFASTEPVKEEKTDDEMINYLNNKRNELIKLVNDQYDELIEKIKSKNAEVDNAALEGMKKIDAVTMVTAPAQVVLDPVTLQQPEVVTESEIKLAA